MTNNLLLASSIIAAVTVLLPIVFHLTRYLGAKNDNIRKNEPYESGVRDTNKDPFNAFNVKFYLVGVIFLLFDVEVLFLFPWAITLQSLGVMALVEMFIFIALLGAGLIYIYKSGVLRWI